MKTFKKMAAFCMGLTVAAGMLPAFPAAADDAALPSRYDLREKGLVSKVQDQMQFETSWAFAALGSIETNLLMSDPGINLSEWHLAYYTYSNSFGYPYSTDSLFNASTYDAQQETGILTSWIGPVSEISAPVYGDVSIEDSMLSMDEVREQAEYHVTRAVNYNYDVPADKETLSTDAAFAAQRDAIKQSILEGNAIDMSFIFWSQCQNFETNAYCYNLSDPDEEFADSYWHSVDIVGWDDAFPAASFTSDPGMDGAWLCKDSRGVTFGDNGYFWLSYADPTMDDIYEIHAESAKVHNRLYQHDVFGNSGSFSYAAKGDESVMAANIFTAEKDGWLTSVMFCNVAENTDAEFVVYSNLTDENNPISGTASEPTTVKLQKLGYQTFELSTPVALKKGEHFAIVAKLSGEGAASRIPCEFATHTVETYSDGSNNAYDSGFTMEMLGRDFATGQSFYSTDGTYWFDMFNVEPQKTTTVTEVPAVTADDASDPAQSPATQTTEVEMKWGNICMKGVTRDCGTIIFSDYSSTITPDTKIALSNDDQAPIYYSLDGEHFSLYEEPIGFPENTTGMTISAYADLAVVGKSDDKTVFTQNYTVKTPMLTSVLCKDAEFADYAVQDVGMFANELYYSVPEDAESLTIVPISAGTITIGEQQYTSGQEITLPLTAGDNDIKIKVAQEGLADAEYTLHAVRMGDSVEPPAPEFMLGDVTEDGVVNASDAARILTAAAALGGGGEDGLTETQRKAADVNGDGVINASDAAIVLIYAAAIGGGQDVKLEDFIKTE